MPCHYRIYTIIVPKSAAFSIWLLILSQPQRCNGGAFHAHGFQFRKPPCFGYCLSPPCRQERLNLFNCPNDILDVVRVVQVAKFGCFNIALPEYLLHASRIYRSCLSAYAAILTFKGFSLTITIVILNEISLNLGESFFPHPHLKS